MSSSNNNRNSLSQFCEKSLKRVSEVYIQTKQSSIKLLSALNINLANKYIEKDGTEYKSNHNSEDYEKKINNRLDSKPAFFNPLTPYQIENYHNFITDTSTPYNDSTNATDYSDDEKSPNRFFGPNDYSRSQSPYLQKFSNERDFSDQESFDDHDDYFSRQRSNYSSQSSSSSISTYHGITDLVMTPLPSESVHDKRDEGYEFISEEEVEHIEQEKAKEKSLKRRKSSMKSSNSSLISQRSIRSIRSINKLSLKLNKNKSSPPTTIGTINFEEFIGSLDISEDLEDRLQWLFRFYDNDGDGLITRDEMLQIIHCII